MTATEPTTEAADLIAPMRGYVAIRRDRPERQTEGGLYIPEDAQAPTNYGVVHAVGEPRLLDSGAEVPSTLRRGMRVVYRDHPADVIVELGDHAYVLIDQRAVLAKVPKG